MPKQMPQWATRVIAAIVLVAAYFVHHAGIIPPDLKIGPVNVLGALNDIVLGAAAVGLNGPQLWPWLARVLGNPSAAAVDADKKAGPQ